MNGPDSLFAYRKVFFEGQWHLRCIDCSDTPATNWDRSESWKLFLKAGQPVVVSLTVGSCETSGSLEGPSLVYGRDAAIKGLSAEERCTAILAQQYVIVVTNSDLRELTMPVFINEKPSATIRSEITIRFTSPFLENLPDVLAYYKGISAALAAAPDLALFESIKPLETRIPVGLYLPASIQANRCTQPVVYSIKEWQSDDTAKVELFTPGEFVLNQTKYLTREVPGESLAVIGICTPA